jgi:hypothetical protein
MSEHVRAFNDARCPKCFRRISWYGAVVDCPPCSYCGTQIDIKELEHDQHIVDDLNKISRTHPLNHDDKSVRTNQRQIAGLSRWQAAVLLEIDIFTLKELEEYNVDPLPWLQKKMIEVYSLKV